MLLSTPSDFQVVLALVKDGGFVVLVLGYIPRGKSGCAGFTVTNTALESPPLAERRSVYFQVVYIHPGW